MFTNAPGAPSPKTGKIYNIKGTQWIQEPMEYYTFLKALDLLRGRFNEFFAGGQTAGDMIDALLQGPAVPEVVRLILRPHSTTPWGWIWNRWRMVRAGIDPADPLPKMTLQEVADVVLDFFDLNIGWIGTWIEALMKSFSSTDPATPANPDGPTPSLPKNLFLSLLGEILNKPGGSGRATP